MVCTNIASTQRIQSRDQPIQEEFAEVQAELEVVVALRDLNDQAGGQDQQHHHHLHQHQREQLGAEQYPPLQREGVDDLVQLGVALAPHQFAGIENDDGQGEDGEAARRPSAASGR